MCVWWGCNKISRKGQTFQVVCAKELHWNLMVFFLNGNSVTKIFVVTVKGLEPDTFCVREQDVTAVPVRHLWEVESLNWAQFMLQRFIRSPNSLNLLNSTKVLLHLGKTALLYCKFIKSRKILLSFTPLAIPISCVFFNWRIGSIVPCNVWFVWIDFKLFIRIWKLNI